MPGDVMTAAALFGAELVLTALAPADLVPPLWPEAALFSLVCAVPIALRRWHLRWAIGLAVLTVPAPVLIEHSLLTQAASFLLLTYSAAAAWPARPAVVSAVVLWLPVFVAGGLASLLGADTGLGPGFLILYNLLVALVAFFIGRTVHARRASTRALEERAEAAEANQRAMAAQAVADERRRIARELHDVVAHHVSVMGVLATGARRVLERRPEAADEALATIEDTSRSTLREMRRLLDVLRTEAEPAAELTPQPGLAGIETLIEQVREAGLPVVLRIDGVPDGLDPGVALTVYRVVQEALTNAIKHAGRATAEVRLRFGVYWLTVEVADTGRGPAPGREAVGHGLLGMRERVALFGGTLRTGPRPGGGYRVYARIPVEQHERRSGGEATT